MDFSLCRLDKGEIWVATCRPPVSAIRSVWVPINFAHGGLSLVQRGSPTVFPILRSGGGGHMPPLSLPLMAQRSPNKGLISLAKVWTPLRLNINRNDYHIKNMINTSLCQNLIEIDRNRIESPYIVYEAGSRWLEHCTCLHTSKKEWR